MNILEKIVIQWEDDNKNKGSALDVFYYYH